MAVSGIFITAVRAGGSSPDGLAAGFSFADADGAEHRFRCDTLALGQIIWS